MVPRPLNMQSAGCVGVTYRQSGESPCSGSQVLVKIIKSFHVAYFEYSSKVDGCHGVVLDVYQNYSIEVNLKYFSFVQIEYSSETKDVDVQSVG